MRPRFSKRKDRPQIGRDSHFVRHFPLHIRNIRRLRHFRQAVSQDSGRTDGLLSGIPTHDASLLLIMPPLFRAAFFFRHVLSSRAPKCPGNDRKAQGLRFVSKCTNFHATINFRESKSGLSCLGRVTMPQKGDC